YFAGVADGLASSHDWSLDCSTRATDRPVSSLAAVVIPPAVTSAAASTPFETGDSVGKSLTSNEVGSPAWARWGSKTTPGSSRSPPGRTASAAGAGPGAGERW